jgi:GTP cyclohydrolase-4
VREMVRGVLERFPDLPDEGFLHAHQANFETIHTHDVEAERFGGVGEIRGELAGGRHSARHLTLQEWLAGGS